MSNLRIVHVIEGFDPDRWGPDAVCAALAAAEARLAHDVTIVCEGKQSPGSPTESLPIGFRGGEGVRIERVQHQRLFSALYGDLRELSPAIAGKPDMIHIHGVWSPIGLAASRAARRSRIPYLLSTHGALHPICLRRHGKRKQAALVIGWRRMLRSAARVLCLNGEETSEANRIARAVVAEVLPDGIDTAAFKDIERGVASARFGGRGYFVFVGRFDRARGLDQVLDAYVEYRRAGGTAELALIGQASGEQDLLAPSVVGSDVRQHLHVFDALDGQQQLLMLADAIALVHRPRFEAFGMAVVEALACGTPAILGERCLLPVVGEPDGVIFAHGGARQFARAMMRLERDSALRESLGDRARACAQREFDWDMIALRAVELGAGAAGSPLP